MLGVITGLGLVGWGGVVAIGGLLGGAMALQRGMSKKGKDKPGKSETAMLDPGGEDISPMEAWKQSVQKRVKSFEASRQSTVIQIVHHAPNDYVDHETAIEVIDVLRKAPANGKIDVILHTPGGVSSATQQILHALREHKGPKTAFVPYRAKSAGTMIAMACDQIVMGSSAQLGPIDPQYSWLPAQFLAELPTDKNPDRMQDEILVLSKMAKQAMREARRFACDYVNDAHKDKSGSCSLTDDLVGGGRNHDYPILPHEAVEFGLNVSTDLPEQAYDICQPPPKDEPFLIFSMFNSQNGEQQVERPQQTPAGPFGDNGFR